jgi:hypothetical protein
MQPLTIPKFLLRQRTIKTGPAMTAIKRTFLAPWLKANPSRRRAIKCLVLIGEEHAPLAVDLYDVAKVDGRHKPFATVQLKDEFTCQT